MRDFRQLKRRHEMTRKSSVTLMDKACFRSGNPAGARNPNDRAVLRAVADVEALLDSLPLQFPEPAVHAATTLPKDDEIILRLHWNSSWQNPLHNSLSIS